MSYHKSSTSILSSLDKDYIEEGRTDIYKWGETRSTRRRGMHGWAYAFKKRFIDKSLLKSFLNNLTVSLLLQLILSGLCTYICQRLGLSMDVHIALFVSPIIFPLAFSINADFQRREHVLEDLALFKGGLIVLFFCHRDWHIPAGLGQEFLKASTNKLKGLILNIKEYLLTESEVKRSFILQVIYEDFSDISQMNEKIRVALKDSASLIQRLIHCHNLMFWAFERLRVIREYRSPRGIRSFTKVFIFVMPILISPYYVFVGISSGNTWSPYYISLVTTFVFGTLQGVQDVLDDPFDGISEDDVNLGSLEDWTAHSLLTNRTYTVGRFTVTASVKTEEPPKPETVTVERKISRSPSFRDRVNAPLRSILRRASNTQYECPEFDRPGAQLSTVTEEDVGAFFPAGMVQSLETMKQKGMTGSTTILPGFNFKEHKGSQDDMFNEVDGDSNFPSLQRSASTSDLAEAAKRRRAYRHKNVSFSQDLDDDGGNNSLENSLSAGDEFPLLRDSAKLQASKRSQALEPDADKFSKELLDSLGKLQNASGTERVSPAKMSSKGNMPPSLASLFQAPTSRDNEYPDPTQNHHKSLASSNNATAALSQPSKSSKEKDSLPSKQNKRKASTYYSTEEEDKIRNELVEKPRFSVSKTDSDSTQRNSITTFADDDQVESKPSRFAVKPNSQSTPKSDNILPQASHERSPSPSRNIKIQPSTKRLPSILSPQTPETKENKLGNTNHGLCNEEIQASNTPAKQEPKRSRFTVTASPSEHNPVEDQTKPSRFTVSGPTENKFGDSIPQEDQKTPSRFSVSSTAVTDPGVSTGNDKSSKSVAAQPANSSIDTPPQEDRSLRERQSSFWDFANDDIVDADPNVRTLSKNPSIEEMLTLSDNSNNEVFI